MWKVNRRQTPSDGKKVTLPLARWAKNILTLSNTVKSLLFVGYQFSWFSWVGWSKILRIQRTMKHGKQFDIDILVNAVLEWPQLLDQLHRVQLTILMTKEVWAYLLMGYNLHEHVCELFDFECMCKNDRNVYMLKDLTTSGYRNQIYFQTIHWR